MSFKLTRRRNQRLTGPIRRCSHQRVFTNRCSYVLSSVLVELFLLQCVVEYGVELTGDAALEAPHDLWGAREVPLCAAFDVGLGGAWQRMRVRAMTCSARFAWRSPARLSLCRIVLPQEAGSGLVPHSAANDASLVSRSGLPPAVMSNCAVTSGPTQLLAQPRSGQLCQLVQFGFGLLDLGVEVQDASGQPA